MPEVHPTLPPETLVLHKTVILVSKRPTCVAYADGSTYVINDLFKAIDVIGHNSCTARLFMEIPDPVWGSFVYKDKMYTLTSGDPCTIRVYDLSGRLQMQWSHPVSKSWYIKMTRVGELIVVPDRLNKRLVVYSLHGEQRDTLPCPILSDHWVAICAVDDSSAAVSDCASSQVIKIDVASGDVLWVCRSVTQPLGIACYRKRYLCVASCGSRAIQVLDADTGETPVMEQWRLYSEQ